MRSRATSQMAGFARSLISPLQMEQLAGGQPLQQVEILTAHMAENFDVDLELIRDLFQRRRQPPVFSREPGREHALPRNRTAGLVPDRFRWCSGWPRNAIGGPQNLKTGRRI